MVSFFPVCTYVMLGLESLLIIRYNCGITRFEVGYCVPCISKVLSYGILNVALANLE